MKKKTGEDLTLLSFLSLWFHTRNKDSSALRYEHFGPVCFICTHRCTEKIPNKHKFSELPSRSQRFWSFSLEFGSLASKSLPSIALNLHNNWLLNSLLVNCTPFWGAEGLGVNASLLPGTWIIPVSGVSPQDMTPALYAQSSPLGYGVGCCSIAVLVFK